MSRSACIHPTEKLSYVISCTHWSERWTGQYLVVAPLVSNLRLKYTTLHLAPLSTAPFDVSQAAVQEKVCHLKS